MIRLLNKRKDYIVSISCNNKVQFVQVKAKSKREALSMVTDVLMKCSIFSFISNNKFELSCRKYRKSNVQIKN